MPMIYPSGTNFVAKDRKSKWRILAPVDAYIRAVVTCHCGRGHVTSRPIGTRARAVTKYDRYYYLQRAILCINAACTWYMSFLLFCILTNWIICHSNKKSNSNNVALQQNRINSFLECFFFKILSSNSWKCRSVLYCLSV